MTDTDKIRDEVEEAISPYFPEITDTGSFIDEVHERQYYGVLMSMAVLRELQGEKELQDDADSQTAGRPYHSWRDATVPADGYLELEADFFTNPDRGVDIRDFTADILVYGGEVSEKREIEYNASDAPVVGAPIGTDTLYIATKSNTSTDIQVQMWG
jgi:hypothetical protein